VFHAENGVNARAGERNQCLAVESVSRQYFGDDPQVAPNALELAVYCGPVHYYKHQVGAYSRGTY